MTDMVEGNKIEIALENGIFGKIIVLHVVEGTTEEEKGSLAAIVHNAAIVAMNNGLAVIVVDDARIVSSEVLDLSQ